MGKTTNILDLNNRLEKVEKENVAQNSYTSLKNKPKINSITLTGNKTLADIGAAAAADLTTLATDIGDLNAATTTDKSSVVAMVNEVNGKVGNYINIMNDVTVDANISIRDSKIEAQKIGKMVFVNLIFTTQAQISANTSFIQGVPYSPKINSQSFVLYKQGTSTGYVVSLDRVSGTNTCNIVNRDVIPTGTDIRGLLSIPT